MNNGDEESDDSPTITENNPQISAEIRTKSGRNIRPPGSWWAAKSGSALLSAFASDPKSYSEAIKCTDSKHWKSAMDREIESLNENTTWVLVPRPSSLNVVSSKWVFVTKEEISPDGNLSTRYKARLVARGFSQVEGVDFSETYAPVDKFTSVRVVLAIVSHFDLELHQWTS